ncbi:uncharacterized protein [Pseudochaenichthys georgianus]|nr:uncharacterized protein LOC117464085 isoform X2 [Pseudochaenichthys georgianus]XP_033962513.1 uncharacterized protein LOC117464085 isoform X2 [Pseudochaenichthys georgianus]XP_033962514.1 uncharacterized protein LOC117464085 isoform X2 [Pseudochaenichthys georgianus]
MLPSPTGPCQNSSRSLVFGLGPSITSEDGIITGAKLPTGRQILRCMLGKKPGGNGALSQFEATKGVLEQVRPFYKKANIPMVSDKRACHKMVDLVYANNKLRKISQAKRSSETTAKQLEKMECRLDATFPLWPPNVEKLIDNPEDLAFLASMKTNRVATFGVLDKKLQLKVKRREERQAAAAARQSRCEKELEKMTANVFIPHDILSRPSVVSLATRLKMSPTQQAAFTRALVAESGGECTHLSASYATAYRARRQVLETISEERHKQWTPPPLCTLHWDSKLTPMLSNVRQLEERLTVVVGDAERLKLLRVPAYKKQTNEACGVIIARLTCKSLQDWCYADQVVNMAFDTTASNTGHLTAACIAIQLSLGRPLLWPGCRHHIGEVLLNQVFTDLKVETSRSPEVTLFTRLREKWNLLPQESSSQCSRYIPGNTEQPLLGKLRAELVRCAKEVTDHKRGDYREFVHLCLVFLDAGGEEQNAVTFQRPGALHKAR